MDKLKVWSNSIKKNIEDQKDDIFKRDYKFFKIDQLERIAERVDDYSEDCEFCQKLKPEIEDISLHVAESINGSPANRSKYEKRNNLLIRHLRDDHGLIQRDYNTSVYSLAGFAGGSAIFGGIAFLIDIRYFIFGLLLGFSLGIMAGRIYGRKKDRLKEKEGLIL